MILGQNFLSKYKTQFYSSSVSLKSLKQQQKQLIKLLQQLHQKTQTYFNTICSKAQQKNQSHSLRSSLTKSNLSEFKLPSLVTDAQIKNSHTYRKILEKEKIRLERRVQTCQFSLKQRDINLILKSQREKVVELMKNNKNKENQIKKLGDKLVQDKKPAMQICEELAFEVHKKKKQNRQKMKKLEQIQQRIAELEQQNQELEEQLQKRPKTSQPSPKQLKTCQKAQHLKNHCQALKQNIESISKRLSQQYFLKLKQLEKLISKGEQLDAEIQNTIDKIQVRVSELYIGGAQE